MVFVFLIYYSKCYDGMYLFLWACFYLSLRWSSVCIRLLYSSYYLCEETLGLGF